MYLTLAALAALFTAFPSLCSVLRVVFSAPAPGAFGFAFFRLSRPDPIFTSSGTRVTEGSYHCGNTSPLQT